MISLTDADLAQWLRRRRDRVSRKFCQRANWPEHPYAGDKDAACGASEEPGIVPQERGESLVRGSVAAIEVAARLGIEQDAGDADTVSGLLTLVLQRVPEVAAVVEL